MSSPSDDFHQHQSASATSASSSSSSSSSSFFDTSTLVLAAALLLATLYSLKHWHTSRAYPPGPRGYPLLGYLDILWSADRPKLLKDLRSEYGDVLSFALGSRLVVVVSGFDTLKKVFVGQGSSLLARPQVFAVIHGGQEKGVHSASSKETWQDHHQFMLRTLKPLTIGKHCFADKIQQELEALCNVLDTTRGADTDPAFYLHTATANIVLAVAFGNRFDYDDPAFVRFMGSFLENLSLSAGSALQHFFPFLRLVPGDVLKRQRLLKNAEHVQSSLRQWVDAAKRRFDPNDVGDLMDAYFKEMEERKMKGGGGGGGKGAGSLSYEQLQGLVGDLVVSGTEFTATTLRWLLIFLVRWPHVQRKLRHDIDSLYPDKETPSAKDRGRLPYVEATLLECQRFADVCPFSLARAASEEMEVEGGGGKEGEEGGAGGRGGGGGGKAGRHQVPKGALVVPNLRWLHHDPALWGDPENFRPERFLNEGQVVRPQHLLPFSVGDHSCPGEELGRLELFLFLTALLQRYEIRPAVQGKLPSLDGHFGLAYAPYSYKVRFIRRDQPEEEEGAEEAEEKENENEKGQGKEEGGRPISKK